MPEVINIIGQGVNAPHIHIFNNCAYLYAADDYAVSNARFVMQERSPYV